MPTTEDRPAALAVLDDSWTGEPGHETWSGDSWKTGGGPTWVTGAYDVAQNLIIWGTGNPSPDWNGDSRLGDNLY